MSAFPVRRLLAVRPAELLDAKQPDVPLAPWAEPQLCPQWGQGYLEIVEEFCRRITDSS
jgi:hypothetical protein